MSSFVARIAPLRQWTWPSETTRLHHTPRRRGGGLAARGGRAAAGEAADHWLPGCEHAFVRQPSGRCLRAAAARTRLDRGPHGHDRVSMVGGPHRELPRDRSRIRAPQGRCHRHDRWRCPGSEAGHISDTNRVPCGRRPGWRRLRCDPGPTGRQCYRLVAPADRYCQQASGASARRCARSPAHGGPIQWRQCQRDARAGRDQKTARTLGLAVATSEIRRADDIVSAFEALKSLCGWHLCRGRPAGIFQPGPHPHLGHGRAATGDLQLS